jgi:hypothetical protein
MADDRQIIMKRLIQSLKAHADELQAVADEMEGDGDETEEAQQAFGNVTDAVVFMDTAREKLEGVVTPDEAE